MRAWLNNNKVFFEVSSSVLLGIMAVIISGRQLATAKDEYRLHYSEKMPLFKFDYEQIGLDSLDFMDTEFLTITNEGGAIKKFDCAVSVFYEFSVLNKSGKSVEKKVSVYIPDFYAINSLTNKPAGKLLTAWDKGNNLNRYNAGRYCSVAGKMLDKFVNMDKVVYFKIVFTDINDDKHTQYYDTYGNEIDETSYKFIVNEKTIRDIHGVFHYRDINQHFIDSVAAE